ncbi:hypothetical protein VTN77DRAFT_9305 [Rasamsonia byssochlamydoides]|uniref:uncharacterized protein n=1 Tax=Rasamsonia byssochlamydoides TaxID=89139 RepID=UPI00374250FE
MAQSPPAQHPQAENTLEVDEAPADTDSAYNGSIGTASYVSSLSSSIKDYKYENGRRYHAYHEGAYIAPNDEEEQDRIDLLHHIYLLMLGGRLYLAPIGNNPQRVLDLGTGTGIWAIQFADDHPSAQVIGTDLSAIQPSWVPPNCIFEIDDYESTWLYKTKFDFIHGRELEGCVADEDRLFSEAFEHLKSGGYFEFDGAYCRFFSDDDSVDKAENLELWSVEGRAAGEKFGKSFMNAPLWKEKMEKAGFVDVKESVFKVPIGPWPKDPKMKELGRFQQVQQIQAIESYTPALFSRILGWTSEEVEVLVAKVRNELKDRSLHLWIPFYFVYGRKP